MLSIPIGAAEHQSAAHSGSNKATQALLEQAPTLADALWDASCERFERCSAG